MNEVITAHNLTKVYQTHTDKVTAIRNVNLKLYKGDFCLLMGASGSGKSTLLHLIGALDRPTGGEVLLNGVNPFSSSDKEMAAFRNRHIGFIFQFHYLINELSVLENVMVPLLVSGVGETEARRRAETYLQYVKLEHRLSHRPFEISGGERQRAAVARALVTSPDIVLADEPTGNLDSKTSMAVISLMRDLNQTLRTTFFIATHNAELEKFADRVYFIKDGALS